MDGLTEQINEILKDPQKMENLKQMANNLFAQNGAEQLKADSNTLSDVDVGALMKVANLLKSGASDNRADLLLALKPHLSGERSEKIDKAVKILRLLSIVPILRQEGILDL